VEARIDRPEKRDGQSDKESKKMKTIIESAIKIALEDALLIQSGRTVLIGSETEDIEGSTVAIICSEVSSIDDMPAGVSDKVAQVSIAVTDMADDTGPTSAEAQLESIRQSVSSGSILSDEIITVSAKDIYFQTTFVDRQTQDNIDRRLLFNLDLTAYVSL